MTRYLLVAVGLLIPSVGAAQVPQNLSASAGDQEVTVNWERPQLGEGDFVVCYRLYRDTTSLSGTDPGTVSDRQIATVDTTDTGAPSYTDTGVTNGTTYFYRVTAETAEEEDRPVSCGGADTRESDFSNQEQATPFASVELRITEPRVPVSEPVEAGTPVPVTAEGTNIPDDEPVELLVRQGGQTSFTSVSMTRTDDEFTAPIPGESVTARGVEFAVATRNKRGDPVRVPGEGIASIRVQAENLSFTQPGGTAQSAYRMVSFPTQLDDPRLSALFEESLGAPDPTEWRVFAIGETGADDIYRERTDMSLRLETGTGVWLISRSGGTPTADRGTTVRTDRPFQIPLREGWNLIGNPFAFDVPVSQLRVANSEATLQGSDLFGYTGSFVPQQAGDVLGAYAGYLVRLSDGQTGTLVIDPTRDASKGADRPASSSPLAWQVDLSARVGQARDDHNTLGVGAGARRGRDARDGREPPPIGDFVSLAFGAPEAQEPSLWRDIRPARSSLQTWTAEVQTNVSGVVTIGASRLSSVPDEKAVWLQDTALGVTHNLRAEAQYRFSASGPSTSRRIRILVGEPEAVQRALETESTTPTRVRLLPSAPHPVRSHTTVRYAVPEPTRVTLRLYDLLGRQITTFVNEKQVRTGTHTYNWTVGAETQALSSGTYFLRLEAGGVTRTRRVVVVQ
ncbi:MAG: T9SS type A sorting domain-containing protein [Salinivenus sp.]